MIGTHFHSIFILFRPVFNFGFHILCRIVCLVFVNLLFVSEVVKIDEFRLIRYNLDIIEKEFLGMRVESHEHEEKQQ